MSNALGDSLAVDKGRPHGASQPDLEAVTPPVKRLTSHLLGGSFLTLFASCARQAQKCAIDGA
jgi:hypothetical protein